MFHWKTKMGLGNLRLEDPIKSTNCIQKFVTTDFRGDRVKSEHCVYYSKDYF